MMGAAIRFPCFPLILWYMTSHFQHLQSVLDMATGEIQAHSLPRQLSHEVPAPMTAVNFPDCCASPPQVGG
jgi:hypothetical protein